MRVLWGHIRRELWARPEGNFAVLDGLRGFASVIVVFFHCALFTGFLTHQARTEGRLGWLAPIINGLWSGIDIFFVLSGFLIARILMLDLERTGTVHYRRFLTRRFFRIFPAYYLILTFSVFVAATISFELFDLLFGSLDRQELVRSSWMNYVYLNNYLRPGNQGGVFSWGWSLCIEEHFYLILPPLLWLLFRHTKAKVTLVALAVLTLAPLVGRLVQYALDPNLVLIQGFYYYSHNRFDEIFVGVFIAYLYVRHRDELARTIRRFGSFVWVLGVLLIASVWVHGGLFAGGMFAVVFQFIVMALGTALLLVNGIFQRNAASRFFAHPLWYPLARISYGTYLIHPFVLFAVLEVWLVGSGVQAVSVSRLVFLFIMVMTLASIVAAVLFLVVESPMLRVGVRWSRRYAPDPRRHE